jgi:hypothetical protein
LQRLAFLPIGRQRLERTDFATTHDGLHYGHPLGNRTFQPRHLNREWHDPPTL